MSLKTPCYREERSRIFGLGFYSRGHKIGHTSEIAARGSLSDPLNKPKFTLNLMMVGKIGFEPPTPWSRRLRSRVSTISRGKTSREVLDES
jgi:hypothetical protein